MVRSCDWFIPIIPPIIAFSPATNIRNECLFCCKMNAMMHRGAIFCHDDRIRHDVHEIDDITDGYQK